MSSREASMMHHRAGDGISQSSLSSSKWMKNCKGPTILQDHGIIVSEKGWKPVLDHRLVASSTSTNIGAIWEWVGKWIMQHLTWGQVLLEISVGELWYAKFGQMCHEEIKDRSRMQARKVVRWSVNMLVNNYCSQTSPIEIDSGLQTPWAWSCNIYTTYVCDTPCLSRT